jgi:DNA-binding NtrC family response regulator
LQDSASYTGGGKSIARPRNAPPRILVVDDEPDACELLRQILESEGYDAIPETSASSALDRIAKQDFDLVVSDVIMAEMDGLDLCRHIVESRPEVPVILLTGRGNMNTVISALRSGARDFLTKPLDAESVATSVARILQRHALKEPSSIPPEEAPSSGSEPRSTRVLGQSEAIREVYRVIAGLSDSSASVLLQGETGTGKEVIARAIHENSRFKHGPFVALNCAAMPAGLLESELFGHARGAFTDARSATKGLLVQANGGTLLLDEIGELPLAMQPKLLRALQERTVRPWGEAPRSDSIAGSSPRRTETWTRKSRRSDFDKTSTTASTSYGSPFRPSESEVTTSLCSRSTFWSVSRGARVEEEMGS